MRELFNQADIDANRQGKLSPTQEKFIKASVDPKVWLWGAVICLGLGLLGAFLLSGSANAMSVLGPILGLVFLFCAFRWLTMWNLGRKLLKSQIIAADGAVTFKKLDIFDQWRYSPETQDGKRLYPQGLAGMSVMLPPGNYRFYHLPTRNWLLSSEPLSSEAELQANMVKVLGNIFGFNPSDLEVLRAQAASGDVKTVEGRPTLTTVESLKSTMAANYVGHQGLADVYAEIGGIKFYVPRTAAYAFIPELHYRVYYYEKQPTNFMSKIVSVFSNTYIAGIEPL